MLEVRPVATVPLPHINQTLGLRIMLDTWVATQPPEYPCLCFLLAASHLPHFGLEGGCMVMALAPEGLSVALLLVTWASCVSCFRLLPAKWGSLLPPPLEPRG